MSADITPADLAKFIAWALLSLGVIYAAGYYLAALLGGIS